MYFLRLIGGCRIWKEMRVKICLICLKKGPCKYSCLRSGIYFDMTLYASWIFKTPRHDMGIISLFSNIFLILDINESLNTTNCIKYNFIHQTHQIFNHCFTCTWTEDCHVHKLYIWYVVLVLKKTENTHFKVFYF